MEEISPSPALGKETMFIGPRGLRSGWRVTIYLAMVVALLLLLSFILNKLLPKPGAPWSFLIGELVAVVSAFLPAFVMTRIEKRFFGTYGLPASGAFGKQFWIGALWGIASLSLLLLAIRGVGDFSLGGLALHGPRILKFALFWGVVFLCVGFFEEFLFRGYTLSTLTEGMGFWPAALILSAIFGGVHLGNQGEAWIGALAAAMIGLFFCLTLRRTGTLWWAVGFHASWDWAESYFYSVPDSGSLSPGHLLNTSFQGSRWITGGTVGPEGSAFVPVLLVLLWIIFDRLYPDTKFREQNPEL